MQFNRFKIPFLILFFSLFFFGIHQVLSKTIDEEISDVTKQIFLHLPKKSNATFLANQIKNLLELNNLI